MFKKFTLFTLALMPLSAWGLDFENFKLENGLDVYVIEDHRTPVVVNFVWYKAGAGDEEEGKTGLAHMLEHLMFKGTENIPPQEFSKIVARHGGKDNAFTSYDYTAYFQKVAKENLPKMMEIEAERMTGLTFTDQEFQKYLKRPKYKNRIDLFRKIFKLRTHRLRRSIRLTQWGKTVQVLQQFRGLCHHIREESETANQNDLRSKQVKQLEIRLRKLIATLDKNDSMYYEKMQKIIEDHAIEASICKVLASEALAFCVDEGVQIFGGAGFIEEY
ncbi:MAG: hypothetical protein CFH43_00408, partial [Proteobacteria bacterium]